MLFEEWITQQLRDVVALCRVARRSTLPSGSVWSDYKADEVLRLCIKDIL